jgi:hypothetical protein
VKRFRLRLIPEQPLALDDPRFIPAAALRGALATAAATGCVPGHPHDLGPCKADCRYWRLFGETPVWRITAAYAGTDDDTAPFLATARTCAISPGFKARGGHGVFDTAIRAWLSEGARPDRLFAPPYVARCPVCAAPLIQPEGLVICHNVETGDYTSITDIATPVQTSHTTFSRTRRRIVGTHTESGSILGRGIYYSARLDVPDELESLFRELIGIGLWIGARRSRGMGGVQSELIALTEPPLGFTERIARFNRIVRAEKRFYAAMDSTYPLDDGDWYFTIDLFDPVFVAYDRSATIVPTLPPGVLLERAWIAAEPVSGWHIAAGLPRRTQLGARGVLLCRAPADQNRGEIERALAGIEQNGLGRQRGYGTAGICDPFHLHLAPL